MGVPLDSQAAEPVKGSKHHTQTRRPTWDMPSTTPGLADFSEAESSEGRSRKFTGAFSLCGDQGTKVGVGARALLTL